MVQIKNPFGSLQTNPKADAWWVPPFFFWKSVFVKHPSADACFCYFLPNGGRWRQPRSSCVPPPTYHPQRPESHEESPWFVALNRRKKWLIHYSCPLLFTCPEQCVSRYEWKKTEVGETFLFSNFLLELVSSKLGLLASLLAFTRNAFWRARYRVGMVWLGPGWFYKPAHAHIFFFIETSNLLV